MVVCRVTFDFYNKSSNGLFAKKEWSETVEVFGARKCDIMTEDGLHVQERFELLLLVEMGLTPDEIEEFDYHTVECMEHDVPDDFFDDDDEDEEEDEETDADETEDEADEPERYTNGEMVIEIDRETGKFEIISDGGKNGKKQGK